MRKISYDEGSGNAVVDWHPFIVQVNVNTRMAEYFRKPRKIDDTPDFVVNFDNEKMDMLSVALGKKVVNEKKSDLKSKSFRFYRSRDSSIYLAADQNSKYLRYVQVNDNDDGTYIGEKISHHDYEHDENYFECYQLDFETVYNKVIERLKIF